MTTRIVTDANGRKHITNEPLLQSPKRDEWEGLSVFEINDLVNNTEHGLHDLVERTEAKLKEKNHE